MAYQQVALELVRDGQCTPWGFRLTGGADIGAPLVVQKVAYGTPSEGELQKGDIILKVRDKDATRLSHQVATDLISKTGSTLSLVVARNVSQVPGAAIPGMPVGKPLMNDGTQSPLFKPLPTTNFGAQRQRRTSTESFTSTASSDTEKDMIVNQPYRSTPLILPAAKSTKDPIVGSYLRFDPLAKRTSTPPNMGRLSDSFMISRVQEAVLEAAHSSSGFSSPGRTPTPDMGMQNGPQVCIKQYNSPINMYSNQAIVEALAAQTVLAKSPMVVANADVLETKKLSNIKNSPTYQLIHDEEWRRGKIEEHEPLQEHVYNVLPGGRDSRMDIHQSESFKSIMHDLKGISDF